MDFCRPRRVNLREGWALSDNLVKNPYASRFTDPEEAASLCAEFRRMLFENDVPVRPSRAHYPDYMALTETELRDMMPNSRASIHGIGRSLREAALEKFPPLSNPQVPPSHVLEPVEAAQVVILFGQNRQLEASMPLPRLQFLMKG